jgi:Tfp pilus assembly protein PilF
MTRIEPLPTTTRRRYDVYAAISLAIVCGGVYANSLTNPLLRDDKTAAIDDPRATDPGRWREIFTRKYWHGFNDDPIYRPLTTLSLLVNRMVLGERSWGYRIVNIVLHAGVCIALYLLGVRMIGSRLAAWLGAMLFAVLAVHNEAVTSIVGRADLAVGLLLILVAYLLLGRGRCGGCEPWRWSAIVVLVAVSLFVKETAFVALPLVVFIQLWQGWAARRAVAGVRLTRRGWAVEIGLAASVAAVSVAAVGVRYGLFGRVSRPSGRVPVLDNPLGQAGIPERLLTGVGLLGKYLGLLAWPHPLCCDYSYRQIPVATSVTDGPVLVGVAWIAGIAACMWLIHRCGEDGGWRVAVWCVGFFAITYSVVSNTGVIIGTIFGERLIYVPSIAWCVAFGAGAAGLIGSGSKRWRVPAATACAGLLLINAGLTVRRNTDWHSVVALWEHDVTVSPESARAWSSLSKAYGDEKEWAKAIESMEHALRIYDGYWDDHLVLSEQYASVGRLDAAAASARRAFELARGRLRVQPAYRFGQFEMQLNHTGPAIQAFQVVVTLEPNHVLALNNLAYLQATSEPPYRDTDAALAHIQRAIELAPKEPLLYDTAADVYLARGQRDAAIHSLRRGLEVGEKRSAMYAKVHQRLAELTTSRGGGS